MASCWALQACLQRAEFEGEMIEATLVNGWLALEWLSVVERYTLISAQFLSRTWPDLIF